MQMSVVRIVKVADANLVAHNSKGLDLTSSNGSGLLHCVVQ